MRIITIITKVTRLLRVADLVRDITSDASDEELMAKHNLTWRQLAKVYSRLYHNGSISHETLVRRVELRGGRDASHIPLADLGDTPRQYACLTCGFTSRSHFTNCPRCSEINLRRLSRRRMLGRDATPGPAI